MHTRRHLFPKLTVTLGALMGCGLILAAETEFSYNYDSAGRLVTVLQYDAQGDAMRTDYTYDTRGNLLSRAVTLYPNEIFSASFESTVKPKAKSGP